MKSTKRFTVRHPSEVFWLSLTIVAFFIILMILNIVFSSQSPAAICISITIFIFIPCGLAMLWSKVFKITVDGDKITVRKCSGAKYSFNVDDIASVLLEKIDTPFGLEKCISVKTNQGKTLSVDILMPGFEDMSAYIKENVDQSKISTTHKALKRSK